METLLTRMSAAEQEKAHSCSVRASVQPQTKRTCLLAFSPCLKILVIYSGIKSMHSPAQGSSLQASPEKRKPPCSKQAPTRTSLWGRAWSEPSLQELCFGTDVRVRLSEKMLAFWRRTKLVSRMAHVAWVFPRPAFVKHSLSGEAVFPSGA